MNKDQDNSQTEQQVQKDVRTGKVELLLGRLTDTLDKSLNLKRTQEALKNTREDILRLETESSCDSHLLRRMTVVKRQETQAEKHKAELWSRATILQLEEIQVGCLHQEILGGSRKCTSDCQIFEQFQKEDGVEWTHTSQLL